MGRLASALVGVVVAGPGGIGTARVGAAHGVRGAAGVGAGGGGPQSGSWLGELALCEEMVELGLVADYRLDPPGPRLMLHDVMRAYLQNCRSPAEGQRCTGG